MGSKCGPATAGGGDRAPRRTGTGRFLLLLPFFDRFQEAAIRLHGSVRGDARSAAAGHQTETLGAYSAYADWYARMTRGVTPYSPLRTEILEFCRTASGTVLDAGAGCCRDAVQMARGGRDVVAVDAVPGLLEAGPQHARVRPVTADVRALPLRGSSVGAVWCSAVLLHMDAAGFVAALREFLRVLTPDGFAQISLKEGDGHSVEPMADSAVHRRHFFSYPLDRLREFSADAGFRIDRTWTGEQADSGGTVQTWRKLRLRPLG